MHYAVHSTWLTVKNFAFVVFAVGLPLVLYVVFSQTFTAGAGPDAGLVSAMIMVSMAAYGALGAAMSGGAQLATERRSGWFRQLSVTTLAPREFLLAKAGVIMVLVLPSLLLVFGAGFLIGGVRLPAGGLARLPRADVGGADPAGDPRHRDRAVGEGGGGRRGHHAGAAAAGHARWPLAAHRDDAAGRAQALAQALPSYWLAEFGRWPMLPDTAFPWTGVLVLLAWVVGLTVLGALGFRRATASSKR